MRSTDEKGARGNRTRSGVLVALLATLVASVIGSGCAPRIEDTPEYKAVCHGPPLRGVEQYEEAQTTGYDIDRRFDCITQASFAAVQEEKARWEAANTPEAKAKKKAELAAQHARDVEEWKRKAAEEQQQANEPVLLQLPVLKDVDANTATEAEIAAVISIGAETAAQIVAERSKRRFSGWNDLVSRVVALSAAQTAAFASVCGLTVNGNSLSGAEPDPVVAAGIRDRYARNRREHP